MLRMAFLLLPRIIRREFRSSKAEDLDRGELTRWVEVECWQLFKLISNAPM